MAQSDRVSSGWVRLVGSAASLLLACGGESVSAESEDTTEESGETGLADDDICATVLDPNIYTSPAWTPTPLAESDPECPRVEGNLHIALPAPVLVTGTARLGGIPTETYLSLTRRSDDSRAIADVEPDGSFSAWVLPGRYDVRIGMPEGVLGLATLALEDVELTAATELLVDGPAPITISGSMTMDGQAPPDPFGYIRILPTGVVNVESVDLRMGAQTYEITLGPGSYEFSYSWCDYSNPPPIHAWWGFCVEEDGLPEIPLDEPKIGPVQFGQTILSGLVLDTNATLDIDVPTVVVSGTVLVDGLPAASGQVQLRRDGQVGILDEGLNYPGAYDSRPDDRGQWGGRVVAGVYDVHFDNLSGPVHESVVVDQDTIIDLDLTTATISGTFPTTSPITSYGPNDSLSYMGLHINPVVDIGSLQVPMYDGAVAEFEQEVYTGRYEISLWSEWCWPDLLSESRPHSVPIVAHDLDIQESVELSLSFAPEELARVSIDIRDPEHGLFPLFLVPTEVSPDDPPVATSLVALYPNDGELVAHGVMVPGHYQLRTGHYQDMVLGELDIVDGTTVRANLESAPVSMTMTIGDAPFDPTGRVYLLSEAGDSLGLYASGMIVPPGRYDLRLRNSPQIEGEGMPQNVLPDLGCVTLGMR